MRLEGGLFSDLEIRSVYTVSELTDGIRLALENSFPGFVHVEGEISNVKESASGHVYFTLKDAAAQIRGVFFKGHRRSDRFLPEEGTKVLAHGRIGMYQPRGEYQLIVHSMEPAGLGKFFLEFRRVRSKLESEGLLDPSRKRVPPLYPRKVALITSLSGAVLWDFIRISGLRSPSIPIVIVPVAVQGERAASEIVEALSKRIPTIKDLDCVVLARGGGSVEDLWPFNDELLAREMIRCSVPIVSAVGHETNVTIADLVSDLRVATPSEAAEKVFPRSAELLGGIRSLRLDIERNLQRQTLRLSQMLVSDQDRLSRWPDILFRNHQILDRAGLEISASLKTRMAREFLGWERSMNRMGKAMGEFLSGKRVVAQKLSGSLRSPYTILLLRRKRWERLYQRLSPVFKDDLRKRESLLKESENALFHTLSSAFSRRQGQLEENRERLMRATPFSALEKGFAILFHSDTRKLVSPANLPVEGENVLARIPGFEVALKVVSIQPYEEKKAD
ncbi:MAG: exodeoxyribonuclease VII large subunit [Leptospirales bacterium]